MRIGSLFSGIGGLELGLEWAGVGHTVWQVEIDPFCREVLTKHWPDVTRYEDITEVDWSTVEPVEVICGGFPCQDISLAGRGAGLAGERSGLWREYLRAVRGLRPCFVVVENVSALLARGLGDVLADLAACGYNAEWDCIPAAAVGAPHRRDRLFVVAYPNGEGEPGGAVEGGTQRGHGSGARTATGCGLLRRPRSGRDVAGVRGADVADADGSGLERHGGSVEPALGLPAESGAAPADVADADGRARRAAWSTSEALSRPHPVERPRRRGGGGGNPWAVEPDVGRVAHGVPRRVDRLRALGNAVVPQVAEVVGRRLMELAS